MKRKWKVFKDYYLKIAILVVAVLIFICYARINRKENVLQIIMMDVRCPMEQQEEFERKTGEVIGLDSRKEFVELAFCHSEEMFVTIMVNDKVDMFLMNEAYFEMMLSQDCLSPMDDLLKNEAGQEILQNQEKVFRGKDGKIYGISVIGSPWIQQFELESTDDIILGIVDNGPNDHNTDTFVRFLLEE